MWLGKLTALDMTRLGCLGRKISTQTNERVLLSYFSAGFSVGLNIFISNQSFGMHMIFTYNDTLIRLELKQRCFSVVSDCLDFSFSYECFREQIIELRYSF